MRRPSINIVSINKQTRGLNGKRVLLRLDLNVPLKGRRIMSDYKLKTALPTISFLLAQGCSIIIMTHLGRPRGTKKDRQDLSVKPLVNWFSKKLRKNIKLLTGSWPEIYRQSDLLKKGQIVFLENIRFFPGETKNSPVLAKHLARLADIYVNDAFAASHRRHTSVSAIKKYLPAYAGLLLAAEVKHLERIKNAPRPLVLVMGGAKILTKLPLLKTLGPRAQKVLIGGAVANTILKAKGKQIGLSLWDKDGLAICRRLSFSNIVLPKDVGVLVGRRRENKLVAKISAKDKILDIGPATIASYTKFLEKAKTIVWNGPMGAFEKNNFDLGTKEIAKVISQATKRGVFTLIGGGETITAANILYNNFSWISTGGGATLDYLTGQKLPGLTGIVSYKK